MVSLTHKKKNMNLLLFVWNTWYGGNANVSKDAILSPLAFTANGMYNLCLLGGHKRFFLLKDF